MLTRREVLNRAGRIGAGAIAAFASARTGFARDEQFGGVTPTSPKADPRFPLPPTWETELREVAPNVYAYIQAGGPGRDNTSVANAGIVVGDEGVLVIDTLTAPLQAKTFVAAIRKVTDKPFQHVVYTHHHGDHINGAQFFEGATIVGHPYCRSEVVKLVPGPALWARRDGWADGTEPRRILPPTITCDGKLTYYYGRTVVELLPMVPAHTYGDIAVNLPQHKVLFAGDIAFFYVAPWCQNAHPSKWIDRCDAIERMDVQTIVAGHGPLGTKSELADMRGYLTLLKSEARKRYDAKLSAGRAAAEIRLGKYDNWIGPERIVMDVQRFYAEFAGTLTPDVDVDGIRRATEEYNSIRNGR